MLREESMSFVIPEDSVILRDATQIACIRANAKTDRERESLADSVLWLARCGYARHSDGTLDAAVLADAAITVGGLPKHRSVRRTMAVDEVRAM